MSGELKVYRVTNKSPLRNGGMFRISDSPNRGVTNRSRIC